MRISADYIDYIKRTLPAGTVRLRLAPLEPAVILLEGKPVGLLMPMR